VSLTSEIRLSHAAVQGRHFRERIDDAHAPGDDKDSLFGGRPWRKRQVTSASLQTEKSVQNLRCSWELSGITLFIALPCPPHL